MTRDGTAPRAAPRHPDAADLFSGGGLPPRAGEDLRHHPPRGCARRRPGSAPTRSASTSGRARSGSSRRTRARAIARRLPPASRPSACSSTRRATRSLAALAASGVHVAQLHGDEPPALCASLPVPVVKAIRVVRLALARAARRLRGPPRFLLDSASRGLRRQRVRLRLVARGGGRARAAGAARRRPRARERGGGGPDGPAARGGRGERRRVGARGEGRRADGALHPAREEASE